MGVLSENYCEARSSGASRHAIALGCSTAAELHVRALLSRWMKPRSKPNARRQNGSNARNDFGMTTTFGFFFRSIRLVIYDAGVMAVQL